MLIYTPERIAVLEVALSPQRLSTYISATRGDKERALNLYVWNSRISAAFYTPLQGLEVALRNAMHNVLCGFFKREDWYEVAPLDGKGQQNVLKAKETVQRLHRDVNPPHVVAELSFGFWLALLGSRYHPTLWVQALHRAFPNAARGRADIVRPLDHLRVLRNRVAHHEPVFSRHLELDYRSILDALGWICTDTQQWIAEQSSVLEVLQQKP